METATIPQWHYGLPKWVIDMNDTHEIVVGRETGWKFAKATCSIAKGIQAKYVVVDLIKQELVPNVLRPTMHPRNSKRLIEVWIEEKEVTGTHECRW